jgi:hypothetical protein
VIIRNIGLFFHEVERLTQQIILYASLDQKIIQSILDEVYIIELHGRMIQQE